MELKRNSEGFTEFMQFLKKNEVAKLLQCSPRQVDYLKKYKGLPYVEIGGLIRYDLESVKYWALNQQKSGKE